MRKKKKNEQYVRNTKGKKNGERRENTDDGIGVVFEDIYEMREVLGDGAQRRTQVFELGRAERFFFFFCELTKMNGERKRRGHKHEDLSDLAYFVRIARALICAVVAVSFFFFFQHQKPKRECDHEGKKKGKGKRCCSSKRRFGRGHRDPESLCIPSS